MGGIRGRRVTDLLEDVEERSMTREPNHRQYLPW